MFEKTFIIPLELHAKISLEVSGEDTGLLLEGFFELYKTRLADEQLCLVASVKEDSTSFLLFTNGSMYDKGQLDFTRKQWSDLMNTFIAGYAHAKTLQERRERDLMARQLAYKEAVMEQQLRRL